MPDTRHPRLSDRAAAAMVVALVAASVLLIWVTTQRVGQTCHLLAQGGSTFCASMAGVVTIRHILTRDDR